MTANPQPQNADDLRKAGKYDEAIPLYQQMIETSPSSYPTRWLIYCLRKKGRIDEAYQVAQEGLERFPKDPYLRSEMCWVIYDREIKPGRESGEIGKVINAARRALELDPDNEFLLNIVGQTVLKTAKKAKNPDWKVVAEFAEKIDPGSLSTEKRKASNGKFYMSEREDWYLNLSRAYLEAADYQKAIDVATAGLVDFPKEFFLIRTIALAQFRLGDPETAAKTMRPLLQHPKNSWYVRAELAEIEMQLGNQDEAYRLLCQSLDTRQNPQFKVKNMEVFAGLCLELQKLEEGLTALTFARIVRSQAGWSIPTSLIQLEEKCRKMAAENGKTLAEISQDQGQLAKLCSKIWKRGALEGKQRFRGWVSGVRPDRSYAFIQPLDGGESTFVLTRDLPRDCVTDGVLVEYSLEKSFDAKKNRESFKAAQVIKVQEV